MEDLKLIAILEDIDNKLKIIMESVSGSSDSFKKFDKNITKIEKN